MTSKVAGQPLTNSMGGPNGCNNLALNPGYAVDDILAFVASKGMAVPKVNLKRPRIMAKEVLTSDEAVNRAFGLGVDSTNRGDVMLDLLPHVSGGGIERINFIKEVWSSIDDMHHLRGELAFRLSGLALDGVDFRKTLNESEHEWFEGLGNTFKVYRGCSEDRLDGLSWTTDREVAMGFAGGHRGIEVVAPVLVSATCDKVDVLLAVNDREEFEIVVEPEHLTDVWVEPVKR